VKQLEELKLSYRRTFNTDDKSRFGYEATTFSDNPHITSFNEGQRAAVLLIVRMLAEGKEPQ
jgi:hypothetical protein